MMFIRTLKRTTALSAKLLANTPNNAALSSAKMSSSAALRFFSTPASQRVNQEADFQDSDSMYDSSSSLNAESAHIDDDMEESATTEPSHLDSLSLHSSLKRTLETKFKIETLYPIQAQCFEPVVGGRDIVGKSRTGTGKTLAFVLPLAEKLMRENASTSRNCAQVVIIEPTRELALQVEKEIKKLTRSFSSLCAYGGTPFGPQAKAMSHGVDFLVRKLEINM
jgi:ATP-dependent RNA helicase DDX21